MRDINKPLTNSDEHAILLLKPDGFEKEMLPEIMGIISKYGLKEIERRSFNLSYHEARDIFIHTHKLFTDYITRSHVVAILLYGKNAVHKVRLLKTKIRKYFHCEDVENLIHSPDSGMEYLIQSRTFFPHITADKFPQFSDFYAKVTFPCETHLFSQKMLNLQKKSAAAAFVLPNERFDKIQDQFHNFINRNDSKIHITTAMEYYTVYKEYKFKVVSYYPLGQEISNLSDHCNSFYPDLIELIALIKDSGGFPFVAPVKHLFGYKSEYYEALRGAGVVGAIIYHPSYSLEETTFLLEEVLGKGGLVSGGSGGILSYGQVGVSFELFHGLYQNIYKKSITTDWINPELIL
ncbi:hypothetical protein J7E78_05295 [Paenibacillus polymyxa]|uniref:nucleoside-diphosphate kinase n=1 Tax=Paenibacillus polymyxa TaxID=1406 RepID=UPI001BE84173|nr:nucleoside-diphosphate kinase [Paenibacillus polymyxa]MBT2282953.1 hypothetical protein [Paenibacillus polymyxa]